MTYTKLDRLSPDLLSLLNFLLGFIGSIFILMKWYLLSSVFIFFSLLSDVFDGIIARSTNKQSIRGTFMDAKADRFVDICIISAILLHGGVNSSIITILGMLVILLPYLKLQSAILGYDLKIFFDKKDYAIFLPIIPILLMINISFLEMSLIVGIILLFISTFQIVSHQTIKRIIFQLQGNQPDDPDERTLAEKNSYILGRQGT